jgi:hypothetical protein
MDYANMTAKSLIDLMEKEADAETYISQQGALLALASSTPSATAIKILKHFVGSGDIRFAASYYANLESSVQASKPLIKLMHQVYAELVISASSVLNGIFIQTDTQSDLYEEAFCSSQKLLIDELGLLQGIEAGADLHRLHSSRLLMNDEVSDEKSGPSLNGGFLFISGMPRSGTTALGRLINISDDAAIYTELYRPCHTYRSNDFTEVAVNAIRKRRPDRYEEHGKVFEKSKTAKYVGDKIPLWFYASQRSLSELHGHTISAVHIVRDIRDTCSSYEFRANNPDDRWPLERNHRVFVRELNAFLDYLDILITDHDANLRKNEFIIAYDCVFGDVNKARKLLNDLNLEFDDDTLSSFVDNSSKIVGRNTKRLPKIIEGYLQENINIEKLRIVEKYLGVDIF